MYSFGVSNHSPDQALQFLKKRSIVSDLSEVAIVPSGTILSTEKKPSRKILFILSVSDFYKNINVLNSKPYTEVNVFLFASPLRIAELTNTTALDSEPHPANQGLGFLLSRELELHRFKAAKKNPDLEGGAAQVKRLNTQYLTLLTDNVKTGSLLNPLMTFLYTLPSATHQTPVKEAVATYLFKGGVLSKLEELLDGIRGIVLSRKVRDRLKVILKSPEGDNMKAAFKEMREIKKSGKAPVWAAISKKHSVSTYELKYIKSVYDAKLMNKGSRGTKLGTVKKAA